MLEDDACCELKEPNQQSKPNHCVIVTVDALGVFSGNVELSTALTLCDFKKFTAHLQFPGFFLWGNKTKRNCFFKSYKELFGLCVSGYVADFKSLTGAYMYETKYKLYTFVFLYRLQT